MSLLLKLINQLVIVLTHTPFYPYWLFFKTADSGNANLLSNASGNVLNVGCGADDKRELIESNKNVNKYITLDYPGWDNNWQNAKKQSSLFGRFSEIVFHTFNRQPNLWADGYDLPFFDSCFNTVVSQGVLEHISNPVPFLKEHQRVLVKDGLLLMTTPLLYESHGGNPAGCDDYYRFTEYGLKKVLSDAGFISVSILPYGNFGTALSQLINSFIIKSLFSLNHILIFLLLPITSILFFMLNIIFYIIDKLNDDICYTAGFFIIARSDKVSKIKNNINYRCCKCHSPLRLNRFCDKCHIDYLSHKHGLVLVKRK
jgi:SAM-dependent methyltransferase